MDLCEHKNQLKAAHDENCCLKKTMQENEREFEAGTLDKRHNRFFSNFTAVIFIFKQRKLFR